MLPFWDCSTSSYVETALPFGTVQSHHFMLKLRFYFGTVQSHPFMLRLHFGTIQSHHFIHGETALPTIYPSTLPTAKPSLPYRLGLHSLLCCSKRFLATFAIKCSSWSAVNRGTSYRSPCTSIGYEEYESVISSNKMASRFLGENMFILHCFLELYRCKPIFIKTSSIIHLYYIYIYWNVDFKSCTCQYKFERK